jgi:hypothetical protein
MLHEYHVIYSVRYYPRFHMTALGLGTYYSRIQELYCNCIVPNQFVDNLIVMHGTDNIVKLLFIKFLKKFSDSYATQT